MRVKIFSVIVSLTILFTAVSAQSTYYPDAHWQTRKPEELKINKRLLDSAVSFAKSNETKVDRDLRIANLKAFSNEPGYEIIGPMKRRGDPAGLIIKDGYIIAQWGDVNRVDMTYSVAKSFLSTVAGLAIDNGLIKNVNDRVDQYVWDDTFEGKHNQKITWDNLLTQSSDWSGTLFGISDWADRPPK
ncbi:MAG: serine hydrolase, partial [Chitinophagaceae bacterium]|nr:serine hydrolase [Chitinophagaceae bacterium]